jgi:hypothetical protein
MPSGRHLHNGAMPTFKKLLAFMLGGSILGAVVASLIAPGMITWYNEPGFGTPAGFNLGPFAEAVTRSLLRAQLIGAVLGALLLLALGVVLNRKG